MDRNQSAEDFGSSFISIEDDEGNEFELEHLETIEYESSTYMVFLPADMDEDDQDYGIIILKVVMENGEELLGTVDDETELNSVYNYYMQLLFDDEDQ